MWRLVYVYVKPTKVYFFVFEVNPACGCVPKACSTGSAPPLIPYRQWLIASIETQQTSWIRVLREETILPLPIHSSTCLCHLPPLSVLSGDASLAIFSLLKLENTLNASVNEYYLCFWFFWLSILYLIPWHCFPTTVYFWLAQPILLIIAAKW